MKTLVLSYMLFIKREHVVLGWRYELATMGSMFSTATEKWCFGIFFSFKSICFAAGYEKLELEIKKTDALIVCRFDIDGKAFFKKIKMYSGAAPSP